MTKLSMIMGPNSSDAMVSVIQYYIVSYIHIQSKTVIIENKLLKFIDHHAGLVRKWTYRRLHS